MSRDWTPYELYINNEFFNKANDHDDMMNMNWTFIRKTSETNLGMYNAITKLENEILSSKNKQELSELISCSYFKEDDTYMFHAKYDDIKDFPEFVANYSNEGKEYKDNLYIYVNTKTGEFTYAQRDENDELFIDVELNKEVKQMLFEKAREMLKIAVREEYPYLQFLFGEGTMSLYLKYKDNKNFDKVFTEIDKTIKDIADEAAELFPHKKIPYPIERIKIYTDVSEIDYKEDLSKKPLKEVAKMWFYGKLDTSFYYNERNDEEFFEYLSKHLDKELNKEKKIKRDIPELN